MLDLPTFPTRRSSDLGDGPIKFGSDEHKRLFCKTLLDTHDPYKPAVLDWPKLGEEAEKRITALPIWDIAVQTENRARSEEHTSELQSPDQSVCRLLLI